MRRTRIATLSLLLSTVALIQCGEETPSGSVVENSGPCATLYADLCGSACSMDADCPTGLHCGASGSCTAECAGTIPCPGSQACSEAGRCITGGASGGSGGTIGFDGSIGDGGDPGSPGGAKGDACADLDLELGDVTPTVVLLIDQSGSMEDSDLEPGLTRWDALKNALRDPDGPVAKLESAVRLGFVFYSNDLQLDEPPEEGICPDLDKGGDDATLMPPALNRFQAFADYFEPLGTYRNTPTAESYERVAAELAAFDEPGPKFIVLATDGNPDRCENNAEADPDPTTGGALSRQMVVDAVAAAYGQDITTFVISVGDDVAEAHLNDVANVGQGHPADDPSDRFYLVTTADALTDAFQDIISGVRECTLTLNGEIKPSLAGRGHVFLDGEPLTLNDEDGWRVIDGETIELLGEACEAIKTGHHSLSARFPCEVVVNPPVH